MTQINEKLKQLASLIGMSDVDTYDIDIRKSTITLHHGKESHTLEIGCSPQLLENVIYLDDQMTEPQVKTVFTEVIYEYLKAISIEELVSRALNNLKPTLSSEYELITVSPKDDHKIREAIGDATPNGQITHYAPYDNSVLVWTLMQTELEIMHFEFELFMAYANDDMVGIFENEDSIAIVIFNQGDIKNFTFESIIESRSHDAVDIFYFPKN